MPQARFNHEALSMPPGSLVEYRACYVKYLLPMRLYIQALRWERWREPKQWRYGL